jgi:hypothetical protein
MDMTGVRWTTEQVLALAPDDASRKAGNKLSTAGPWSATGSADGAVWGLCRGSGSRPYQTVVDTTGPAYSCSCPSRKFPCKHALGLLLLRAADDRAVERAEAPPDWAGEWLAGRRARGAEKTRREQSGSASTADPEAARRRAERRADRITAGVAELEQRLTDLLRSGLAGAEQAGYARWEETAARMVDAQAPGLAGRVRELGAIPGSGAGWPMRLLEEAALLRLLTGGWRAIDRLPDPLSATVRTRIGLPSVAEGPPVRDHWLVLAQYDTSDGKITTRRIWLYGQGSERWALLLSFGAAGRSPQLSFPVGLSIEAGVTPHQGAGQLRVEWGEQFGIPEQVLTAPPGGSASAAMEAYGSALRDDPWLTSWPATLSGVIPVPRPGGLWQLSDATGDHALPVASAALSRAGLWKLAALSGGAPVTVFGECGHRGFQPLAVWSDEAPGAVSLV